MMGPQTLIGTNTITMVPNLSPIDNTVCLLELRQSGFQHRPHIHHSFHSPPLNTCFNANRNSNSTAADKFWDCEWPKPIKVIGSGSFGVTYVAKWHMAHVAMKVMKFDEANEEQGFASFFFEVDFHRMLHHPNVVRLGSPSTTASHSHPHYQRTFLDVSLTLSTQHPAASSKRRDDI